MKNQHHPEDKNEAAKQTQEQIPKHNTEHETRRNIEQGIIRSKKKLNFQHVVARDYFVPAAAFHNPFAY